MAGWRDMDEFEYEGRKVRITVTPVAKGKRWDWSYEIDGVKRVTNMEELAPSREVAVDEAGSHARGRIREMTRKK